MSPLASTTSRQPYARIGGLGDLSHASAVYSRDGRYAYVFGRDGALSKIDMLEARVVKRVVQSGNAIGGSISQDGRIVVAQNYTPGGIKAFDAETLELLSEVPAEYAPGQFSKVVGLADSAGNKFAYALFEAGEIWVTDLSNPPAADATFQPARTPTMRWPDGRYFMAGLFGEDGIALLDLWQTDRGHARYCRTTGVVRSVCRYKMPHLRGWTMAQGKVYLPAVGRHEVLVVDANDLAGSRRIPVRGQPVFVMARPDGRQIWVNFSSRLQQDRCHRYPQGKVVSQLEPGKGILRMEFTAWRTCLAVGTITKFLIYSTETLTQIGDIKADAPSGIFFSSRAHRIGF